MKEKFQVKLLDISSIDEQIEVFKNAFNSSKTLEEMKENWIKKHYSNPNGNSYVFGAYDNLKLVSINAFMPIKYIFKEKNLTAVQSCESATLSEYQGKGIWNLIIKTAMEFFDSVTEIDFMLGFPNYINSYSGFIKRKWICVTNVNNYILCGNGQEFLSTLIKEKLKIRIGKLLELQQIKCKILKSKNYKIEFNSSKIFNSSDRNGFDILKNEKFLKWKNNYKGIETISVLKDEEVVLTLFYGISAYKNSKIIIIYDIMYNNFNYKKIRKNFSTSIIKIINKYKDIAFVRLWCTEKSLLNKLAKDLFFIQIKHPNPFIVYPLKDKKISTNELLNPENWMNIAFMDLD